MYYASVALTSGKTVKAVILPNVGSTAASQTPAMHVFDIGISTPTTPVISLRAHANSDIVTADNAGASPLIANRTAIGQWEEFDLIYDSQEARTDPSR